MSRRPGVAIIGNLLGRRDFLRIAGATAVLPPFLRAQAKGQTAASSMPANNRINIGVIGMGWQGPANTQAFLALEDCQVVAACDVDRNHLQAAVKMINDAYGTEDCKGYHDYRELLARPEIDAVMIAFPITGMRLSLPRPPAAKTTSTRKSRWRTPSPSSSPSFARSRRATSYGKWAHGSARVLSSTRRRKSSATG